MKKKTKILIALFLSLLFLASLSTLSFASEDINGEASSSSENDYASQEEVKTTEENLFDVLYGFCVENADKIFSCLAFIGALILSFAYKKGLFPFVEKALSSLTSVVKSLREETERNSAEKNEFIEKLTEKLAASEAILEGGSAKISELEEKLSEAMALGDKTEEFRAVMLAEVEMIYDIFLNSSLPQYQKDKVGEAYAKMKRTLGEKEG